MSNLKLLLPNISQFKVKIILMKHNMDYGVKWLIILIMMSMIDG